MRYYMLNKPGGVVTAVSDSKDKTVMDCFPKELREGLFPVGRLDKDTEGLLLITDDGDFTFRMLRPEFGITKRYFFRAFGEISEEKIKNLEEGGTLYGNGEAARPAFLEEISLSTVEQELEHIPEKIRAHCAKNPKGKTFSAVITVTEGKRHEVKLLLKSIGCRIFYLQRLSMGKFVLDPVLRPGEFREFTPEETGFAEEYRKIFIKL
ncbi:MAG: rRNA pseudouridine synthase [Oscillospiraceae bacterium]|nr:rRNA pseudouridine synthase [Oscillospiraceae bacterium]MBQ3500551.1 rRNA pseudouridine synthase [Oscillospiraceae bacterium]